MYTEGERARRIRKLPLNLLDAVRLTAKSKVLRDALGAEFVDSYVKLKLEEWQSYTRHLSQWEYQRSLDC